MAAIKIFEPSTGTENGNTYQKAKENFIAIAGRKYTPITMLGHGKAGEVWQATSNTTPANSQTPLAKSNVDEKSHAIMPTQFHAVKIANAGKSGVLANELAVLKRLSAASENVRNRFVHLIDHEVVTFTLADPNVNTYQPQCNWLAMGAIPGCTLFNLVGAAQGPLPEELVMHIAIQLSEALFWLHCQNPPIMHGDLYDKNIMLDSSKKDFPGLPNVVLIDFGNARAERRKAWLGSASTSTICYIILPHARVDAFHLAIVDSR